MSDNLIAEIAGALAEPNTEMIGKVIAVIGEDRARDFLRRALEVEAGGGLLIKNGKRRRTPGGVFFHLVRGGLTAKDRRQLWPQDYRKKPVVAGPEPLTWEEAKALIAEAIQNVGEAKTVKVTLVGRPQKVVGQKDCVVVSLKGKQPPSLPKGLPAVPEGSAITWAVFIANKQWNRVKESLARNDGDQLIFEGYPIVGKGGVAAVMATSCKSVLMERAQRDQLRASSEE